MKPRGYFALALLFLLASCGDSPKQPPVAQTGTDAAGPVSDIPPDSDSPSSSSGNTEQVQRGAALFTAQCAGCHTVTDQNLVQDLDLTEMTLTISANMPLSDPARCVGECASDIAAYIAVANPNFGASNTSVGADLLVEPIGAPDPAPVAIRRLNRSEYNNTVRDLFDTHLTPADAFPEDDFGYGFNNIAKVLSVSLAHTEQYFQAADQLAVEALDKFSAGSIHIINCDPVEGAICARNTIVKFGLRVWRRPLSKDEIDSLNVLYSDTIAAGGNFRSAMTQVLKAMLLSPNFLYRIEQDVDVLSTEPSLLNSYELASRLSYFLWSSTPDDILLKLAADNSLTTTGVLREQTQRMLDDPRANSLVENFAVQWLEFDRVTEANPSHELFPNFNSQLVASMRQESRLFMREWFATNAPVRDLVTASHSFIDGNLAGHYGVEGVSGDTFVRVNWQNVERRGILGHAAVLTATSHPANTSPVKRGLWVLQNLLCKAPPPPPPGVENIADGDLSGLTTRERFELHGNTSSICYSCHFLMDPIGFGLENYNAIGQWRQYDQDEIIDSSGMFPGGEQFRGPLELSEILADSPELPLCVAQNLMTYALGRGVDGMRNGSGMSEPPDYPALYQIHQQTAAEGHRIRDIIEEIVISPVFRQRRGADSGSARP